MLGDHVSAPTQVNGFEGIPAVMYTDTTYTEDGIRVDQINTDSPLQIWTGMFEDAYVGEHYWYPNGGDKGYTQITQADGSDFGDLSVVTGNGWGSLGMTVFLRYSLLKDGLEILSGSVAQTSKPFTVSFLGGGFDTINLSAVIPEAYDPAYNGLIIDEIKTSPVPVPAAAWLFGSGLIGLMGAARKHKAA